MDSAPSPPLHAVCHHHVGSKGPDDRGQSILNQWGNTVRETFNFSRVRVLTTRIPHSGNEFSPSPSLQSYRQVGKLVIEPDCGSGGSLLGDEELEDVAGGAPLIPSQAPHPATCEICGFAFGANYPPTKCLGGGAAYECPYVKTGR